MQGKENGKEMGGWGSKPSIILSLPLSGPQFPHLQSAEEELNTLQDSI